MKGKPSAPEPCRQQTVRGLRPKEYPVGGLAVLRALDNYQNVYWMISDALLHHIPGQGRPPGPNGGQAYPGRDGAACRGPPVARERGKSRNSVP